MATAKPHEDIHNYECLDCGAGAHVERARVTVKHGTFCPRRTLTERLRFVA